MTTKDTPSGAGSGGCPDVDQALIAGYGREELDPVAAWSVEAHLPACAACRESLDAHLDRRRLDRNRSLVLTGIALAAPGLIERVLTRCGAPGHICRLLAVTPSLRRSWLTGVTLVLAAAVGAARAVAPPLAAAGPVAYGLTDGSLGRLVPFLVLAPLLPLAGVAAAFAPRLDPACRIAAAAPISGVRLLCLRTLAVVAAAIVPATLAAFALPGPGWLPAALLLPALAVCAVALAAATVVDPLTSAIGAGLAWTATAASLGFAARTPIVAFGPIGQAVAAGILLAAIALLILRRERLDYGWVL